MDGTDITEEKHVNKMFIGDRKNEAYVARTKTKTIKKLKLRKTKD